MRADKSGKKANGLTAPSSLRSTINLNDLEIGAVSRSRPLAAPSAARGACYTCIIPYFVLHHCSVAINQTAPLLRTERHVNTFVKSYGLPELNLIIFFIIHCSGAFSTQQTLHAHSCGEYLKLIYNYACLKVKCPIKKWMYICVYVAIIMCDGLQFLVASFYATVRSILIWYVFTICTLFDQTMVALLDSFCPAILNSCP